MTIDDSLNQTINEENECKRTAKTIYESYCEDLERLSRLKERGLISLDLFVELASMRHVHKRCSLEKLMKTYGYSLRAMEQLYE